MYVCISDGHRGYSLRPILLCFALLCFVIHSMLNVAAQYKMHTERLVTVSMPSGQINSGGISDNDSHNLLHVHVSPPCLSMTV